MIRLPTSRAGRVLLALVTVDVLLIAINLLGAPAMLDLDQERNFTTWYSSAKLLCTALAAVACRRHDPPEQREGLRGWLWPAVAGTFVALSIDETATIHEQITAWLMRGGVGDALRGRLLGGDATKDSYAWPVVLAPLIVVVLYFLASTLYSRMRQDRRSLLLGLAGCGAFLAAILLEGAVVYLSPPIEAWGDEEIARYARFTVIEESAEVAATTLWLSALWLHVDTARPATHRTGMTPV